MRGLGADVSFLPNEAPDSRARIKGAIMKQLHKVLLMITSSFLFFSNSAITNGPLENGDQEQGVSLAAAPSLLEWRR